MVGGALCDRYVPAWTGATGTAGTGVGPAQNGAGMATRSGSTSHAGGSTGQAPASGPCRRGSAPVAHPCLMVMDAVRESGKRARPSSVARFHLGGSVSKVEMD